MLVSVIMSVYDTKEKWLRQSVESILKQTFKDFEFIIVLDCPSDNSSEIINEYKKKDQRIRVLVNENNLGLTKSLNRGLEIAKGKYIARMDSDDISVSYRFERQVHYLEEHQNVVAVGSRCYATKSNSLILNEWTENRELLRIRMLFRNAGIPHPTAMIRNSVLQQHGIRYTEWAKKSQDYKLWTDLLPFGDIVLLPDLLLVYREHSSQISANGGSVSYAHRIAIEKAEELVGHMDEKEKLFHCTAAEVQLPENDVEGFSNYLERLIKENEKKNTYRQELFSLELDYMWCQKAFRRFKIERKTDMLFFKRTLRIFKPKLFQYMKENKRKNRAYKQAVKEFKEEVFPSLCVLDEQ